MALDKKCVFLIYSFVWELGGDNGEGKGAPLQYSCLENPMDGGGGLQSMGLLRVRYD